MGHSYRESKQRFHKGRQGAMLVPHAELSGLLFTINPRQDQRATREAQLYLTGLASDLVAAQAAASFPNGDTAGVAVEGEGGKSEEKADVAAPSTSSLLAAELAEAMGAPTKRPRESHDDHENGGKGGHQNGGRNDGSDSESNASDTRLGKGGKTMKKRPALGQKWFASLETYCKGYMLLNVPTVNPTVTCVVCRSGGDGVDGDGEATEPVADTNSGSASISGGATIAMGGEAATAAGAPRALSTLPPHSIVINPLVSHVVERVFADMMGANASPVFRHCFRLMPAELTCCPTLPEMRQAIKSLLALYFPAPDTASSGDAKSAIDLTFGSPIPVAEAVAHGKGESPAQKKHMHTIVLSLNIKNNTNVEAKKAQLHSQLQSSIPMNRFIVLHPSLLQKAAANKVSVDAVLCVNVIHATCVMGVQRKYAARHGYNLHDLSEEKLDLFDSVTTTKPAAEKQ